MRNYQKKWLLGILVLFVFIVLSGCGNATVSIKNDEDKDVIIKFYDCFTELKQLQEEKQYEILLSKIPESEEVINLFEEKAKENDSDYQEYFDNMMNNALYDLYKSTFCSGEEYSLGVSVYDIVYVYTLESALRSIIEQPLPFEYANEKILNKKELNYKDAHDKALEFVNIAKEDGLDILCSQYGASYPEMSLYNANGTIEYGLEIGFDSTSSNVSLSVVFSSLEDCVFWDIDTLVISNGVNSVEYNSSQMYNMGMGLSLVYFHNSEFDSSRSDEYEILKEIIQSDNISMEINKAVTIKLNNQDVNNLKKYSSLYDSIKLVYENI